MYGRLSRSAIPGRTANGSGRARRLRVATFIRVPTGSSDFRLRLLRLLRLRLRDLLGEIRFQDRVGRRGRGFGAEAAFLHGHDGDDLRVRVRRQHRVPGLFVLAVAFGGAGLAGDFDREVAEDLVGGPARALRGLVQAFEDRRRGSRGRSGRGAARRVEFLDHAAEGVVDFLADVRGDDRAAVAERRVGERHLQRVGLQVALAGGELDVVAGRPGASFGFAFGGEFVAPLLGRQQALFGVRAGRCRGSRPIPRLWAHCCR